MLINIVYAYLEEPILLVRDDEEHRILWSPSPVVEAEAWAFLSACSYVTKSGGSDFLIPRALIGVEPVVTQPGEFAPEVWQRFDRWFTPCSAVASVAPNGEWYPSPAYDFIPGPTPTLIEESWRVEEDITIKKDALKKRGPKRAAMVLGNKTGIRETLGDEAGDATGDIYWMRQAALERWNDEKSADGLALEAYGKPGYDHPRYRGAIHSSWDVKKRFLQDIDLLLCFDNCYHPFWSRGLLSARVIEAIETGCLPVVAGCSDIENFLSEDLCRHIRQVDPWADENWSDGWLSGLDYERFLDAALWLGDRELFSAHRLYDQLTRWASGEGGSERHTWEMSSIGQPGVSLFRLYSGGDRPWRFGTLRQQSWNPEFWGPKMEEFLSTV